MPTNVVIPKLGMTMTEAIVSRWLIKEGQQVEKGTAVLAIETEKITHEVEAPAGGILHIVAPEGVTLPCGETVGVLASSVEEYQALAGKSPVGARAAVSASGSIGLGVSAPPAEALSGTEKVKASPAAKRVARELGIDLSFVRGTGPEGRILEEDIRQFAEAQNAPPPAETERVVASPLARKVAEVEGVALSGIQGTGPGGRILKEDVLTASRKQAPATTPEVAPDGAVPGLRRVAQTIPLAGLRKAIAERMMGSLQRTAQLSSSFEVDATELVRLRQQLLAEAERLGTRVSYNDFIARALIIALKEHPIFNSTIEDNEIKVFGNINLGIAVNLDEGLIVPVVHDADSKSFVGLSKAITGVVEKARARKLTFDDMTGGTFTLSNIGNFDVTSFTPIINPPESAILGVGGIAERPAVVNGQIAVRSMMTICLTWDHRVADGVPAVRFSQTLKYLLENPAILLV